MSRKPAARTFALLGDPVGHSLSPVFQNAALRAAGIDARYIAIQVAAADVPAAVARIRSGELAGANVTIPHKLAVVPLMDVLTPIAKRLGAVNWIGLDPGGLLIGDNTDAEGFARALQGAGVPVAGSDVVVIGAGGAARAAAFALAMEGAARVAIGARREAEARAIVADLQHGAIEACGLYDARMRAEKAAIVVSAVPPAAWTAVAPARMRRDAWLCDLGYDREGTPAEAWARRDGVSCLDGLPMLLHQGALSFERWLEVPFPMDAARAALAGRTGSV